MSKGWKITGLVTSALLVYGVTLALTVPVPWLWEQFGRQVRLPQGVQVIQLSGTIWEGAALVRMRAVAFRVDWDWQLPDFGARVWPLALRVRSPGSDISGELRVSPGHVVLSDVTGQIDPVEAGRLNPHNRVVAEGNVSVRGVMLDWDIAKRQIVAVDGVGHWSGGNVSYPSGTDLRHSVMPPLDARLEQFAGETRFLLRDEGGEFDVAEAILTSAGQAEIRVRRKMLDLVGESWGGQVQAPDAVIFKMKQQLLPAPGGGS